MKIKLEKKKLKQKKMLDHDKVQFKYRITTEKMRS
jgi:hypothetical protein